MTKEIIESICSSIIYNLNKYLETKDSIYQNNITNYLTNENLFGEILNIKEVRQKLYNNNYISFNYEKTVLEIVKKIKDNYI